MHLYWGFCTFCTLAPKALYGFAPMLYRVNALFLLVPTAVLTALVFAGIEPSDELMWALELLVGGSTVTTLGRWTKGVIDRKRQGGDQ